MSWGEKGKEEGMGKAGLGRGKGRGWEREVS